jgi:hypothetical protein
MSLTQQGQAVHEVVGIFHKAEDLQAAIDELLTSGFDRAELSLIAGEHAVEKKLGHAYRKAGFMADDLTIPRTAYVSTEAVGDAQGGLIGGLVYVGAVVAAGAVVVSGGTLAATIASAAIAGGAGAMIGAVLAKWVGLHHGLYLQNQIQQGGLLLWVRSWDAADEARAAAILKEHAGDNVHVHGASLAA